MENCCTWAAAVVWCCGQQKRNVAVIQSSLCLIMKLLCVVHIGLGLSVIFREYNYFRCVQGGWGGGLINPRASII